MWRVYGEHPRKPNTYWVMEDYDDEKLARKMALTLLDHGWRVRIEQREVSLADKTQLHVQ